MLKDRPKLDPVFKENWIKALRSGEYAQIDGYLMLTGVSPEGETLPTGYCCLGVACKTVDVPDSLIVDHSLIEKPMTSFDKNLESLKRSTFFGNIFTHMNDDLGKSFTEIAAFIEDIFEAEVGMEVFYKDPDDENEEENQEHSMSGRYYIRETDTNKYDTFKISAFKDSPEEDIFEVNIYYLTK